MRASPATATPGRIARTARNGAAVRGIRITHPERVIDAVTGCTKLGLARYYEAVAVHMLPHLDGRPVALLRAPEGVEGERFFQKHLQRLIIPQVKQLDPALDPGHAPLIEIDTPAALVGAVQMGAIELHTWNALHAKIERPDRIVFDLDPDPALAWARVLEATELLKSLLDGLGLASFVKTSGGRGLHVVVPLQRRHDWAQAKAFAEAAARHLATTQPERFSATAGAQHRVGKVFVDYLRNSRGATSVCAFSARARAGLPVSTPITWDELVQLESAAQWTVQSLPQRLADLEGHDPWAGYDTARQTLSPAMKRLSQTAAAS
jgi:bifunctional non-homologous end joining protein LigD